MFPRLFRVAALVLMIAMLPWVVTLGGPATASGDEGYDGGETTEFA